LTDKTTFAKDFYLKYGFPEHQENLLTRPPEFSMLRPLVAYPNTPEMMQVNPAGKVPAIAEF
jgi:hypothetical protein